MTSPPTSTKWVPIWPQADPSPPIPTPVNGKWLTVAGGSMLWDAPPTPAGIVIPDSAWKVFGADGPALTNGWVNYAAPYGPARFRKLASGLVVMNGLISSGTVGAVAFTMPTGYLPGPQADSSLRDHIFQLAQGGGVANEAARFNSAGQFIPTATGSSAWLSLAGLTYYAAG